MSITGLTQQDRVALRSFLSHCDGRTSVSRLRAQTGVSASWEPIRALIEARFLIDVGESWELIHIMTSTPQVFRNQRIEPTEAYRLPLWSDAARTPLVEVDHYATSLLRDPSVTPTDVPTIDLGASRRVAQRIALSALHPQPGLPPPLPSAGNLRPLAILAFVPQSDQETELQLASLSMSRHDRLTSVRKVSVDALCGVLVSDEGLESLLRAGSALLVVAVDPSRICAKYGARGWHYATLEAGACMEYMVLMAHELQARIRPIGGYRDTDLQTLAGYPELYPMIAMIVAVEARAAASRC